MRRRLVQAAGLLLIFLFGLWLFREPVLRRIGYFLVHNDGPEKADVIVVLAGGAGGDRIKKGGDLVRQGYAPIALVSGPRGGYDLNECDLEIPYAARYGYPPTLFQCVPNQASSTREEAVAIVTELRRRAVKNYLLVTSDYHSRRSTRVFRATPNALPFRTVPSKSPEFDIDRWWTSRNGLKFIYLEYTKTLAYLFDF